MTEEYFIPKSSTHKKKVIAVGNGRKNDNGEVIAMDVKIGYQILFGQYAGNEIKVDGEILLVMNESDVVAIID